MNKSVLIGLVVLILAAVGAGGWIYYDKQGISVPGTGGGAAAATDSLVITADDKFIGKAAAPVTIVEYFSLGCPHCKNFHENTLPKLKADYIDTGKARLVFRDFPLDGVSLAAAALTRCVPGEGYFAMVDTLFAQQEVWHVEGGVDRLATIAKGAGLDQAAFDACISDKARREQIATSRQQAEEKLKVNATPTMIVNGRKLDTAGEYESLKQAVDAALAAQ